MKKGFAIIFIMLLIIIPTKTFCVEFKDINESDWYYKDINELYDIGIIKGYKDGTFKPNNKVTKSEALSLILEVNKLETPNIAGTQWDTGIIKVASEKGLIDSKTYVGNVPISRQEVAKILVGAMGNTDYALKSTKFKDTSSLEVNYLNSVGIIEGVKVKEDLFYYPESDITRAEISTLINKVYKYKLLDVGLKDEANESTEYQLSRVLNDDEIDAPEVPKTISDFEKLLMNMADRNVYEHTIRYDGYTMDKIKNSDIVDNAMGAFSIVFDKYPEQYCFTNHMNMKMTSAGNITDVIITISSNEYFKDDVAEMRAEYIKTVGDELKELILSGKITEEMSDREKAKVLYEWIILNTEYDLNYSPLSFTGYGQITTGKAVCVGYTSTYNLMLKMLGIEAEGVSGLAGTKGEDMENHIWTKAKLNGRWTYIDVTFGDPVPNKEGYCNFDYFMATREFLEKTHIFK